MPTNPHRPRGHSDRLHLDELLSADSLRKADVTYATVTIGTGAPETVGVHDLPPLTFCSKLVQNALSSFGWVPFLPVIVSASALEPIIVYEPFHNLQASLGFQLGSEFPLSILMVLQR